MSDTHDLASRWAPTLGYAPGQSEHSANVTPGPASQDETWLFSSANDFREDVVEDAINTASAPHTGVMVALFPDPTIADQLQLPGGEPSDELHVTLAYLGEVGAEVKPEDEQAILDAVQAWADTQDPIQATTNGLGIFHNDPPVTYASVDSPQLPTARQSLIEHLDKAGQSPLQDHGFTPHMTLKYDDVRDHTVPSVPMTFTHATVAFAGKRTHIPLGAPQDGLPDVGVSESPETSGAIISVSERTAIEPAIEPDLPESARAISVEVNGKQMIAAPARAITASLREPSLDDITNEHLLWMHGKFVGSGEPNRNGALWSAGDLQLAKGTVANGPLNWLHEARHVIGTIAQADYVTPATGRSGQGVQLADTAHPHITATAAIWKWVWPDEAYVVQQASDAAQLWYSMECISRQVACAGPNGCGNTTSYAAYMAGEACDHVTQRASVRQFVSPVFLGGAVIVPPTRPGWAEADASVMNSATGLAEAAFEQAGQPDIPASTWEQMMAQLVLAAS